MEANMGTVDRLIRLVVALVLLYSSYTAVIVGSWAVLAVVVGVVFMLTAMLKFCPLYTLLGINTCSVQ